MNPAAVCRFCLGIDTWKVVDSDAGFQLCCAYNLQLSAWYGMLCLFNGSSMVLMVENPPQTRAKKAASVLQSFMLG